MSVEAERAFRTLNRLRVVVWRGRRSFRFMPSAVREMYSSDLNEVGVVRAFSILESFLTSRGDSVLRRDLPVPSTPTRLVSFVHAQVTGSFRGAFENPVRFWKEAIGTNPTGFSRWDRVKSFQDLRNLITHALGYVRPGVAIKPSILARLRAFTVDPENYVGRVPVPDVELDELLAVVRDFIAWLDPQVP